MERHEGFGGAVMTTTIAWVAMWAGVALFAIGAATVMAAIPRAPQTISRERRKIVDVGMVVTVAGVVMFCMGIWWAQ